ncbi:MAG: MFS transporter [Rhodospirillales bacterium]|nr:MFS transporter [Rhodospirillales bacterium]
MLAAYALPAFPAAALGLPLLIYLPTFYADATGLGLAAIGGVLLAARLWDVAIDPTIGWLSDRTRTRWGRRRPWLVAALPLVLAASFMLFDPPAGAGAVHLLVWTMLAYLGWSMLQIPHQAWGAELSGDYAERNRIAAWRESMTVAGVALAAALPALAGPLGLAPPDAPPEGAALRILFWANLILLPLAGVLLLRCVPEPPPVPPAPGFGAAVGWALLRSNAPFRILVVGYLFNGVANALPATLFLLYAGDVLGARGMEGALLFVYFLAGIASVPLWLRAAKLWGKHRTWCAAMLANCAAFAPVPFLGAGETFGFLIVCLATGLCFGADLALPSSMQADVVDVDTAGGGGQRAGLYFAIWAVAGKLALAAAPAIAFPLLDAAGYVRGAAGTGGHMALAALYAWVPVAFKLASVALMWNFPLDAARQARLRAEIESRTDTP